MPLMALHFQSAVNGLQSTHLCFVISTGSHEKLSIPAEDDIGQSTSSTFDPRDVNMLPNDFCPPSRGKIFENHPSCGLNGFGLGRLGLIRDNHCLLRIEKQANAIQLLNQRIHNFHLLARYRAWMEQQSTDTVGPRWSATLVCHMHRSSLEICILCCNFTSRTMDPQDSRMEHERATETRATGLHLGNSAANVFDLERL